jgi:hypothetical protein
MAIKAVVNSVPTTRVEINATTRDAIRTVGISSQTSAQNYLVGLVDVDASDVDNNETLVYNSTTEKFVVKILPVVDGGIF